MEHEIEAIGSVAAPDNSVNLTDVTSETSLNANIEMTMSSALNNAIERAASNPGNAVDSTGARAELTDPFQGDFGAEKERLLSDVERAGAKEGVAPNDDGIEAVAETMKGLMHELTTWHVTWGIAQTAQKDLTHVLKS